MITKKDMMNLESLMILLAVEENLGKRKASTALSTSIDTISKYVEHLEEELGIKLLANNGRGSILTPAAQKVIQYAHEIRQALDGLYEVKPESEQISGEVRVGMDLGVTSVLPLHNIGSFFDEYPNIKVVVNSTLNEPNLNTMEFDIAISSETPQGADLVLLATKRIECCFFASPQYLQKHGFPLNEEDMLKNHRLVGKTEKHIYLKTWKNLVKNANYVTLISNTRSLLIEAIKNSVGIGLLPLHFKNEGLVALENIKCEAGIDFNLIANKKTKDTPRVRMVINYYKNLLESC